MVYRAFNLCVELDDITEKEKLSEYERIGGSRLDFLKDTAKDYLVKYVTDGVVDGSELQNEWFRNIESDIFISHSHTGMLV